MTTARHLAREDTHCNAVVAAAFFHLGSLIGHEATTHPAIVDAAEDEDDDDVGSSSELLRMMTDSGARPVRSASKERLRCSGPRGSTSGDDMQEFFCDSAERTSQKRHRHSLVSGAFAAKEEETTLEVHGQWKRQQSICAEKIAKLENEKTDKEGVLESLPASVPVGNADLPSYTTTSSAKRRVIAKLNGASNEASRCPVLPIHNSKKQRTEEVSSLFKQRASRPKIMLPATVATSTAPSATALGHTEEESAAETRTWCVASEASLAPPSSPPSTLVLPSLPRKPLAATDVDEEGAEMWDSAPSLAQNPRLTEVECSSTKCSGSGAATENSGPINRGRVLRGSPLEALETEAPEITSAITGGALNTAEIEQSQRSTDGVEKTGAVSDSDGESDVAHVDTEHDKREKDKEEKDVTEMPADEFSSLDTAASSSLDTSLRPVASSPYGDNIAAAAAAVLTQENREALLSSIQQLVRGYVETAATTPPANPIDTTAQEQDAQQRHQAFPSRCWGGARKATKALKQKNLSASGQGASSSLPASSVWTPCLPPPMPPSLSGQRAMSNSDPVSKADPYGSAFQGRTTTAAVPPFVVNSSSCQYLDADRFLAASSSRPLLREGSGVAGSSPVTGSSRFQALEEPAVSSPPFNGFPNDTQAFRKQMPSTVVGAGIGTEPSEQPSEGATSEESLGTVKDINGVSRRAAPPFEFVSGSSPYLRPDIPPSSSTGKELLDISTRASQVIANELLLQKRRKAEERLLELQRESISVARFLKETQVAEQQLQQTRLFQTVPWAENFSVKNPSTVPVPFPPPLAPTPTPHLSASSSPYTFRTAPAPSSMAVTSAPFIESQNNLDAGVGAPAVAAKIFHRTLTDQAVTRLHITTPCINNNSSHNINRVMNSNSHNNNNNNNNNSHASIMSSGTITGFIPLKPPSDAIVCGTGVLESRPSSPDSDLTSVESNRLTERIRPESPTVGGQSPAPTVLQHAHHRHPQQLVHEASGAPPPIGGARCVPRVFFGTGPIITTGGRRPTDSFSGCCLGCACPLLSGQFVQCTVTACQRGFCHDCLAIAHAALAGRSEVLFAKEEQRCGVCSYQSKRRPTVPQREWHFEFHDAEDLRFAHRLRAALRHRSGLFIEIHHARPPCWRQKSGGKRCHYSFRFYGGIFESRLKAIFQQDAQAGPALQHPLTSRTVAHLASQRLAHSFPVREGFSSSSDTHKLSLVSSTSLSPRRGFLGSQQNSGEFDSQSSVSRTAATMIGGSASSCCGSPVLDPSLTRKGTGPHHSESAPVTPNLMDIGETNCDRRSASPPAGSLACSGLSRAEAAAPFLRAAGYEDSGVDKVRQTSTGGYRASESASEDAEPAMTGSQRRKTGSFLQKRPCSELNSKQRAWWLAGLRFLEDAMGSEESVSQTTRSPKGVLSSTGGILEGPMACDGQGLSEAAEKLLKLSLALSQEAENRRACMKTGNTEAEDAEDSMRPKTDEDTEDDEEDESEEPEELVQMDDDAFFREGQPPTRSEGRLEDEADHRKPRQQRPLPFVPTVRRVQRTSSSSSGRTDVSLAADSLLLREILSRSGLADFPACLSPAETLVNATHTALPCSPRSSGSTGSNRAAVHQCHPFTALERQAALVSWARLGNEAQGGKQGEKRDSSRVSSDVNLSDESESVQDSHVCRRVTPRIESASSSLPSSSSTRREMSAPSSSSASSSSFYSLVSVPLPFTSSHHAPGASGRSSSSSSDPPPSEGAPATVSAPMYVRASSPTPGSPVQPRQSFVADTASERPPCNSGGGDCADVKAESPFSFSELRMDV